MKENLHVHIVDDHSLFREGLHFLLSKCDFISEIEESENGKVFLEKIQTNVPDVVLMDIEMPVMNGLETTMAIRKIEGSKSHIPVIYDIHYIWKNWIIARK